MTRHIVVLLTRYSALNGEEEPPIPLAWLAGYVCFALAYVGMSPVLVFMSAGWAATLVDWAFPLGIIFSVLYFSFWQRELGTWLRVCSLLLNAGIIFGFVLLSIVLFLVAGLFFIWGLRHDMGPG